ncbi:hypothetical protein D9M68_554510 [compost metagenome]
MQVENAGAPSRVAEDQERWAHLPNAGLSAAPTWMADDMDLTELGLDPTLVDGMSDQLTRVSAEQLSTRLLRMERSVLRQERISLEILSSLKKIVAAARKPRANGPSTDLPK